METGKVLFVSNDDSIRFGNVRNLEPVIVLDELPRMPLAPSLHDPDPGDAVPIHRKIYRRMGRACNFYIYAEDL